MCFRLPIMRTRALVLVAAILIAFYQSVPVGSDATARATDEGTAGLETRPQPRPRRKRIRETCAPELLKQLLDGKRETAVTFAKHSQTLCNTSSPWAEANTNVREVLGFVAPWLDHGYKAASFIKSKLTAVSPLWFRILPGRDEQAASAYEIVGLGIADAPEQERWKARIRMASHVDFLPHFSIEGFRKLEDLKAILEAPETLAAEIAVTCDHGKFDGVVFDLRSALFRSLKPLVPRLVKALSGALRASERRLLISVPAGGGGSVDFTSADAAAIASHVDGIIVGTRDYSRETPGPAAPSPWVRASVLRLLDHGKTPGSLRPEQVLLEIPLYGRAFPEAATAGTDGKVILAGEISKVLAKQRPKLTWDSEAKEHSTSIMSGSRVNLSLPTVAFVADRLSLAKSLGVGVALRDLGSGLDIAFDLLPKRPDSGDSLDDEELGDGPSAKPQQPLQDEL